jgi:TonB-dependent starch-binding outer membrane protein SusC
MIEKLPTAFSQYNRDWVRLQEGSPMYSFWLYKQLYVDPQTGNAVYDDSKTNDGTITTDDRQIVGNAWPKFFGGFGNALTYKGFDINIYFTFSYGNKVLNMNRFFMEHGGARDDGSYITWSYDKHQLKRWQKEGDITDVPRLTTKTNSDGSKNYSYQSSRLMEDGSFLRLSNITIGYTLPYSLTSKINLNTVRIYATGTNLWLLTKYLGPDPEINVASAQSGATVQGLDFAVIPQPRTYQLGINISF